MVFIMSIHSILMLLNIFNICSSFSPIFYAKISSRSLLQLYSEDMKPPPIIANSVLPNTATGSNTVFHQSSNISQTGYTDENKYRIRNALLEKALGDSRMLITTLQADKKTLEGNLLTRTENENRMQSRINEMAQELNYLANQLLEKANSASSREGNLLRIIEQGQLNITRARIRYDEYRRNADLQIQQLSNDLIVTKKEKEDLELKNTILLSRITIFESVLGQLKTKAAEMQKDLTINDEIIKRLTEENSRLENEINVMKLQEVINKENSSTDTVKSSNALQAIDLEELLQFKTRLTQEITDCENLKISVQEDLQQLRTFVSDAREEYTALVSSVNLVAAIPQVPNLVPPMILDAIDLSSILQQEEFVDYDELLANNTQILQQMLEDISLLKSQIQGKVERPGKDEHFSDSLVSFVVSRKTEFLDIFRRKRRSIASSLQADALEAETEKFLRVIGIDGEI